MKKITLCLFALCCFAFSWQGQSQIFIDESLDSGVPADWTNNYYYSSSTADYLCEGTGNVYNNLYYSTWTEEAFDGDLTSPNYVGVSNETDTTVEFEWNARPYLTNAVDYIIYVEYSTNDGTDWNLISSFAVTETTACTQYSDVIPAASLPSGSDFKFRVRGEWISGDSYFYLDNIYITQAISCPQPSDLEASNITSVEADLSWTENGAATLYNVEVVMAGDAPTGTATDTGVSNSFTKTGLTPDTGYEYYVQADCTGGDVSAWVGPYAFTTFPSCVEPTALSVTVLTETTASLEWVVGLSEALWNIEVVDVTAGETVTGTPTAVGVLNSYILTDLVLDNEYELYVQSDCEGDGTSTWAGPYSWTQIVPPLNDECVNAIALTVNADLECASTTSGTLLGATASGEDETACFGTENDDVWFSFVATAESHKIELLNITGGTTDLYHSVWSGACGTLTNINCSDPENSTVEGLTIGETYLLRVNSYTSVAGQTSTFDVCIGTLPPPPVNDDCANAIALTVNPDYSCTVTTPGTLISATASGEDEAACFGTENDDVWFSFVATAESHKIELLNITGGTTDLYHSVWSGACGTLTNINCSDPENSTVEGLTIGETYLLRVNSYTSTSGQTSSFDVCIGTLPPPPVNDDCADAIALTVNPDYSCADTTSGTVAGATASGEDEAACFGTENDDVWFSFVATAESHKIELLNVAGSYTDLYHSVWSGACGTLTNINCSDPDNSTVEGLTIGETYLLRVNSYTSTSGQSTTFDVCIGTQPTNTVDFCNLQYPFEGAINEGNNFDVYAQVYEDGLTNGAGQADGIEAWIGYSTTDATTTEDFETGWTWVAATYNTDNGNNDEYTAEIGSGLDPDTYYYVSRFSIDQGPYTYGGINPGSSDGNFWDGTNYVSGELVVSPPPPPVNDLFADAIALTCGDAVLGTTLGATQDESDAPSVTTVEDDTSADNDSPWVWYSYTGTGSPDTITLSTCGTANTNFDTEIFVYTGTSGALTLIDDGYDECGGSGENYAAETTFVSDGTTTYYIAVGGFNITSIGNFQLSVSCESLGLDDVANEAAFTYYPNPVKNTLTLNAQNTIEQVAMYNMLGQEVLRVTPNAVDSDINMSSLQTGTYFVKVTIANVTETIRVIKQ